MLFVITEDRVMIHLTVVIIWGDESHCPFSENNTIRDNAMNTNFAWWCMTCILNSLGQTGFVRYFNIQLLIVVRKHSYFAGPDLRVKPA